MEQPRVHPAGSRCTKSESSKNALQVANDCCEFPPQSSLAPMSPPAPTTDDPYALIPMPVTPWMESLRDDPQRLFATEMIVVHNCFIRGLNSMWRTSTLVKPQDEDAFVGYCLSGMLAIEAHHSGEEAVIFPYLQGETEVKSGMDMNINQHEELLLGMEAMMKYLKSVKAKKERYYGFKVRALVEGFAGTLTQHLHDEIETISPERLEAFDKEGFKNMLLALENHVKKQPNKFMVWPFVASHHDAFVAPNWPPASAPIKWFISNIAPLFHRSYWVFSPFNSDGSPRAAYGSE